MSLEYVIKLKGLDMGQDDPTAEVNVRTDVQFASMAGAFVAGEGDYVTLFEPTATIMEKEGKGYIVASIGAEGGSIPFTAYHAKKSYIEANPENIQKFTNAIYKGQQWVKTHTAKEIAEVIHPHFTDLDVETLTVVMQRYVDINAWRADPFFEKEGFERLMDVMQLAGELDTRAPYDKLIDNTYATKAMK
jgi:NitT/TauT family transport system substrate-binding protein